MMVEKILEEMELVVVVEQLLLELNLQLLVQEILEVQEHLTQLQV
jgi:hypothetical protein|tara:strand:- start:152 stop:286 length:135 start_codon:yes stop_codon:yes gene_type:complete